MSDSILFEQPHRVNRTHQFWFRAVGGKWLLTFNSTVPPILYFTHQDLHGISCCLLLSQFFAPCFRWWELAPVDHCLELKPLKEKTKGTY